MKVNKVEINKIIVKDRIRKDFGNIEGLAKDIAEKGLYNPILITPDYVLLAGERRLRAMKLLGETEISAHIKTVESAEQALEIEIEENENRKDFSREERIEYARRQERIEAVKARERMMAGKTSVYPVQTFGQGYMTNRKVRTDDTVAKKLGIGSGEQYRKEKFIVDNKEYISLEDFKNWDEGKLSTNKAYKAIKAELARQRAKIEELEKKPPEKVEVVKEVIPDDYEDVKKKAKIVDRTQKDFKYIKDKYEDELEKNNKLSSELDKLKNGMPDKEQEEGIHRNVVMFNAGIANFIENYGGYVWLTGYTDMMRGQDKKGFLQGINAIYAWAQQMRENLGGEDDVH